MSTSPTILFTVATNNNAADANEDNADAFSNAVLVTAVKIWTFKFQSNRHGFSMNPYKTWTFSVHSNAVGSRNSHRQFARLSCKRTPHASPIPTKIRHTP